MLIIYSANTVAKWTAMAQSYDYIQYVNLATIRKSGDIVSIWQLLDFKTMQNLNGQYYLSIELLQEVNCKARLTRSIRALLFYGQFAQGAMVKKLDMPNPWEEIQLESGGETLWKLAC